MATYARYKKPLATDVWSIRERLALACSVLRSGDQNWVSVSRAIRPYGEPNRPESWFSTKNCALQYNELLEKAETPKRKRSEKSEALQGETAGDQIIRKLANERVEELRKITLEEKALYKKLKREVEEIKAGLHDDKLREMWETIQKEKKEADEIAGASDESKITGLDRLKQQSTGLRLKLPEGESAIKTEIKSESEDNLTPSTVTAELDDRTDASRLLSILQPKMEKPSVGLTAGMDGPSGISGFSGNLGMLGMMDSPAMSEEQDVEEEVVIMDTYIEAALDQGIVTDILVDGTLGDIEIGTPTLGESAANTPTAPSEPCSPNTALGASLHDLLHAATTQVTSQVTTSDQVMEEVTVEVEEVEVMVSVADSMGDVVDMTDAVIITDEPEPEAEEIEVEAEIEVVHALQPTPPKSTSLIKVCSTPKESRTRSRSGGGGGEEKIQEPATPATPSVHDDEPPASPASSIASMDLDSSIGRGKGGMRGRTPSTGGGKVRSVGRPRINRRLTGDDARGSKPSSEIDSSDDESNLDDSNLLTPRRHMSLSDSVPNSPASISMSDTEDEKAHKVWKKSIMLVWRAAANHKYANIFMHKVKDDHASGYSSTVYRPMDLSTIKKNIENGSIRTTSEFQRDMMLMFTNAIMYNNSDHNVYHMAMEMYNDIMQQIEQFVNTQMMVQSESRPSKRPSRRSEIMEEDTKKKKPEAEGGKAKKRKP